MKHTIRGTTLPVVDVELSKGDKVYTESGGMAWMSPNIEMSSNLTGGIFKSIKRLFSGESLFMVNYECSEGTGLVTFCSEFPGKILPINLDQGQSIICQRDAFMLAQENVDLKMEFVKKIGVGFFGGEGFFLQRITGPGMAFLEIAGEITEYELKEGQSLKVDPGYIAAFQSSVDYDIVRVKGIKNMFFGGEGIFLAHLSGPGKVWLQSMPLSNLAAKLIPHLPKKR